ncbi:MAG TPA: hypothetical protein VF173_09730 [Thermoanaerobaculia bacterium]|nr:hypothetical protein [Thermoanaerobaculia bacterium]
MTRDEHEPWRSCATAAKPRGDAPLRQAIPAAASCATGAGFRIARTGSCDATERSPASQADSCNARERFPAAHEG